MLNFDELSTLGKDSIKQKSANFQIWQSGVWLVGQDECNPPTIWEKFLVEFR